MTKYACPCCGFKTIPREDTFYDLCPVCFWETDPIQLANPHYGGGANYVSLIQGQQNFIAFGACEKASISSVRAPLIDEIKDENWSVFPLNTEGSFFYNKPNTHTFLIKEINISDKWNIVEFNVKRNQTEAELKQIKTILKADLNHRFSIDLTYETNAKYVLKIKEGNTWIHFFNYINWHETAEVTQKWLNEIEVINETIHLKRAKEKMSFLVRLNIDSQIVMSKLTTWRNMDWGVEKFRNIQIEVRNEVYLIMDTFTDFENMLLALQKKMPEKYQIETCFFCRFSSYSVYGNDNFGQLICFKNCKETFLNIKDKDDYIDVLNELEVVNKVEETHYCDEFQLIKASDWIYKNQIK